MRRREFALEAHVGRIEVEENEVGTIGTVDTRIPRVHVDAAHVDHPEQRELVVDERIADHALALSIPRRRWKRAFRNPGGHMGRSVLLKEVAAVDPIGIALHRERLLRRCGTRAGAIRR